MTFNESDTRDHISFLKMIMIMQYLLQSMSPSHQINSEGVRFCFEDRTVRLDDIMSHVYLRHPTVVFKPL